MKIFSTKDGHVDVVKRILNSSLFFTEQTCGRMTLTHKMMQGVNVCRRYQQTKALCPLLYSSIYHLGLYSQIRCYKRPGASDNKISFWKMTDFSLKNIGKSVKENFKLLLKEIKDHLRGPQGKTIREYLLEKTTVVWEFREPEDLQKWIVSSDVEIGGKSQAYLKLGKNNQTALFHGVLNCEVPRDGETTNSGYCTLRTRPPKVCGKIYRIFNSDSKNVSLNVIC